LEVWSERHVFDARRGQQGDCVDLQLFDHRLHIAVEPRRGQLALLLPQISACWISW
jgi:hypothetical protein